MSSGPSPRGPGGEAGASGPVSANPYRISEDWWSVYLGLLLVVGLFLFFLAGSPLDALKQAMPVAWPRASLGQHLAENWTAYVWMYLTLLFFTGIAVKGMGQRLAHYVAGFTVLFIGAFLVLILGSQQQLKTYGLEYPFWALVIGLAVGNAWSGLPAWFQAAAGRTEFFIKMGIVLLGANLPFTTVIRGGGWGFLEALIIVALGFCVAFFAARRLGYDHRFAAVLGAGGSVCGVSAAIAVGSSVRADKREVGYVVSLVVLYALVLIFLLPFLARVMGLDHVVAGAWIGGSELADAAGLAAAAMVSERAVEAFTLVKLNRDVMIGVLAFLLALAAVTRWEKGSGGGTRPGVRVIWERFPKFVLAFLVASFLATRLVVSYGDAFTSHVTAVCNTLRTWLFTLAFLCIGLGTRFRDVQRMGAKPIVAFTGVVLVNLVTGFVLANLFFGGILARPLP